MPWRFADPLGRPITFDRRPSAPTQLRSYLAVRLVRLDLAIEDLDSWATTPDDLAALKRLEELRDALQEALETGAHPKSEGPPGSRETGLRSSA